MLFHHRQGNHKMYPSSFRYHRADSVENAIALLSELGESARALGGGQSLLVLMKMRFEEPTDLVDLGFIQGLSDITISDGQVHIGALATHARIARSQVADAVPIVKDCANGIADNQVRSRGTIAGNLASGDPSCDWPTLLTTLDAQVHCQGPGGKRQVAAADFVEDLYATALGEAEIVTGVSFPVPGKQSGGAYLAFKRCAPAYPTISVGVQLTMDGNACEDARVALGSAAMTPVHATGAEAELRGKPLTEETLGRAGEVAAAEADPVEDQRGSIEFKRQLIRTLVKRAGEAASRRCAGEQVEVSHEYY